MGVLRFAVLITTVVVVVWAVAIDQTAQEGPYPLLRTVYTRVLLLLIRQILLPLLKGLWHPMVALGPSYPPTGQAPISLVVWTALMPLLRSLRLGEPLVLILLAPVIELSLHFLAAEFWLRGLRRVIALVVMRVVVRLVVGRRLASALTRASQAVALLRTVPAGLALNFAVLRSPQQLVPERSFIAPNRKTLKTRKTVATLALAQSARVAPGLPLGPTLSLPAAIGQLALRLALLRTVVVRLSVPFLRVL